MGYVFTEWDPPSGVDHVLRRAARGEAEMSEDSTGMWYGDMWYGDMGYVVWGYGIHPHTNQATSQIRTPH